MNLLHKTIKKYKTYLIQSGRIKYWHKVFSERNENIYRMDRILPKLQEEQISQYWKKYNIKLDLTYHKFYMYCTGKTSQQYIPDDIYYTYIDPYFNDWELAAKIDNKTYYHTLFSQFKQPPLVAYRQNGFWYDYNHVIVQENDIIGIIKNILETCFIKKATDSAGGKGIFIVNNNHSADEIHNIFSSIRGDIVIQKELKQCQVLSSLNPSSVNTLRLLTLLRKDGSVKLCSTILRMGINGAKVDNASSGGITVGVNSDGTLKELAYSADGRCFGEHPSSKINFPSIKIPGYTEIVNAITEGAKRFPHFRLISWDIAIDENDMPILIEANLKYGELEFHQLNNGPVFGDETEKILSEVFQ